MSIVQDSTSNLIGGVSQQTDKLMFSNQVKEMVNFYPKPIDGLKRRPSSDYIKKLFTNSLSHSNFLCQPVFKDNEEYYIILDGATIRVFDFNGNSKTINGSTLSYEVAYTSTENVTTKGYTTVQGAVNTNVAASTEVFSTSRLNEPLEHPSDWVEITYEDGSGQTVTETVLEAVPYTSFKYTGQTATSFNDEALSNYITTAKPQKDLAVTTIGDYTFITNKTVNTALSNDTYPNKYKNAALIFVRQGDYGTNYTVKVTYSGTTKSVTYSTSASVDNNTDKKTDNIASQLCNKLKTALGTTDWTFSISGSCILLYRKDKADFTISVADSNADRNLYAFYDTAEAVSVLPKIAPNGFIVKVIGENVNKEDDYYVKFETEGSKLSFGQGSWVECPAPEIKYKIDPATMPHILRRESNGTFTLDVVDWTERYAGDEYSAPSPSFLGFPIKEISSFKGRLGFLASDKACYSDVEDVFSWFKRSALVELDTDPIEIATNKELTDFQHSLAYNENMYLFSNTSIYNLKGGDIFSNKTVTLDLAKEYQCSPNCKPIVTGSTAMFLFENGNYSRVMELFTSDYVVDVREITDANPSFLPKNMNKMVANAANNLVAFLSTDNKKDIGVYSYYYSSSQKVQSAWYNWTFNDDVIDMVSHNNFFYILWMDSSKDVHLSRMNLSQSDNDTGLNFNILLDNKYKHTFQVSELNEQGMYEVTRSYKGDVVITDSDGIQLPYVVDNDKYMVETDSTYIYIGKAFTSHFKLGHIYVRQTTQTGATKVRNGILMLKEVGFNYTDTGYFKVSVVPKYTTAISSDFIFSGMLLGTDSTTMGVIPVSSGIFKVPIISKNEDIDIIVTNDSFLPSTFLNYDWLGDFNTRA